MRAASPLLPPGAAPAHGGFTLMEISITLVVLAIGILGVLGNIFTLDRTRQSTSDVQQVQRLAQAIQERFQGARTVELGTPGQPWSLPRYFTSPAVNPPLVEVDLLSLGLLPANSGLENLTVAIEYYRAVDRIDASGAVLASGLLRSTFTSPEAFRSHFSAQADSHRLAIPSSGLNTADLGETDPALIRILVRWGPLIGGVPQRVLEVFTARRIELEEG